MDPDTVSMLLYFLGGIALGGGALWLIMHTPPPAANRSPRLVSYYRVTSVLRALLDSGNEDNTEEAIRLLVDVSEESGGIEQSEKDMINNIFEFDDRTASDIMTHRTDMRFIKEDCSLEELVSLAEHHGFSRIPVVQENIDDISGVLNIKDLLPLVLDAKRRRSFKVTKYMRTPLFVPESTRCHDLFAKLNSGRSQIAVVVDEYGGTSGIVTMEDLLESIVGNIRDEYDEEIIEATEITPDRYTLDGDLDLDEVSSLMDCDLEEYIDDGYETIGGLIIAMLDRIPTAGEHPTITIDEVNFTVEDSSERQILKVLAERQHPQPSPDDK